MLSLFLLTNQITPKNQNRENFVKNICYNFC